MALTHVAQRLGHAYVSRRGWFGSQQVREIGVVSSVLIVDVQRSMMCDNSVSWDLSGVTVGGPP
jgi:hypothetical protein